MELATFNTQTEYKAIKKMLYHLKLPLSTWFHVGGMTKTIKSKTDWFWVHRGEKVCYPMDWYGPDPNYGNNGVWCLAIHSRESQFADIDCYSGYEDQSFICQKVEEIL